MTGKKVYEVFKSMFPDYANKTIKWTDKGKNTILIFCEGSTITFTVPKNENLVRMEVIAHAKRFSKMQ